MKKLIYTITIILFCGALAIANNKTNKLENQIESINNNAVIQAAAVEEVGESQEQQSGYTEEDYNKYLEYKKGLIKEYGEEIYNSMNQEAGIKTEEESFKHYMEYGI